MENRMMEVVACGRGWNKMVYTGQKLTLEQHLNGNFNDSERSILHELDHITEENLNELTDMEHRGHWYIVVKEV